MRTNTFAVIAQHDLVRMQELCKTETNLDELKKRERELKELSERRTANWVDTIENKRKMKEDARFEKFKKEELERRRIDQEEQEYQQMIRQDVLKKANLQIYEKNPKTRQFQSQMMLSDALQERELQKLVQQRIDNLNQQREKDWQEQEREKERQMKIMDQKKQEQNKGKLDEFKAVIKQQHNEVIQKYIKNINEDKIEGELIKTKAQEEAIEKQEQNIKEKQKNMILKKERQYELQRREEILKQQKQQIDDDYQNELNWIKKKDNLMAMKNKREKMRFEQYQQELKKLFHKQSSQLEDKRNNDDNDLKIELQLQQQYQKKDNEEQDKKDKLKRLEEEVRAQRLFNIKHKRDQISKTLEKDSQFVDLWAKNSNRILEMEKQTEKRRAQDRKDLQNFHLQQSQDKQIFREQQVKEELEQADKIKTFLELEDQHFKNWAEQAIKEWEKDGKNIKPMLLTLQKGL